MNKIKLFIVGILFLFPMVVFAADEPAVLSVEASANGSTINYTGTTENRFSSEVDNNAFSGSFYVSSTGDYEVRCANFEGGVIKTASVTVNEVTSNSNTTNSNNTSNVASNTTTSNSNKPVGANESNPKTLDNIGLYIGLFFVALLGIGTVLVVKRKKNI
jgi:hypothetical protein